MSGEQQDNPSRELAERDLSDIQALAASEPFKRYFLRRLKQKRKLLDDKFRFDAMSHEDREVHRRLVLEYDEILGMTAKDELACFSTLGHG